MRLSSTTSLCGVCKTTLPAELWRVDDTVVMRKSCPRHGAQEALISSNADWYAWALQHKAVLEAPKDVTRDEAMGCPKDCGTCSAHTQRMHLPVVEITSACSFDCPKCWVFNKNGADAWHLSPEELKELLVHLRKSAPEKRIVNLTGGEPTQHPRFRELVEVCADEGIRRITISTFGLRFVKDEALLERLAELDARIILSFDSFTPEGTKAMMGEGYLEPKLAALEMLKKHHVSTTLLATLGRGVNDSELGRFLSYTLEHDFVRSLELHPLAFTGQSGASFTRTARYTTWDALTDVTQRSQGLLRVEDFVPAPIAHPLCYQVTYLLRTDVGWLPFPRFMEQQDLRDLLTGTLYLEPSPLAESTLRRVIERLWSKGDESTTDVAALKALKGLVERLTDARLSEKERLRAAERDTKAIYLHTHMDEETFDTDRVRQCPIGVPRADGTNVPSCSHTVLYRERDERFAQVVKAR